MSVLDDKWLASDYVDCGQWGVLTDPSNFIVIGTSVGLTREMAEKIAAYHNKRVSGERNGGKDV